MQRLLLMAILSAPITLAACTYERVVVDDSAAAKFARMMGGTSSNGGDASGAWTVQRNDQPNKSGHGSQDNPDVHVVKEADFSGYKFSTNFQVDDARNKPGSSTQPIAGSPGTPGNAPLPVQPTSVQPTGNPPAGGSTPPGGANGLFGMPTVNPGSGSP